MTVAIAASASGCSHDDVRYPAGWAPIADTTPGCPDLVGAWRPDARGDATHALGALARTIIPAVSLFAHWDSITIDPDRGGGAVLRFHRQAAHSTMDATMLNLHLDLDPASCSGGMLTVRRREASGGLVDYRLGRTTAGELVVERISNEREPLLRWGDVTLLAGSRRMLASWGRLPPGFAPEPRAASVAPITAPVAIAPAAPPPALLPPTPATRAGALPLGEAQAIVLSALPDTAVFLGMTPTPRGYALRVGALDAKGMAHLKRQLAIDGHFSLQDDAAAPPAPDASAVAGAREGDGETTLDLVERGLR